MWTPGGKIIKNDPSIEQENKACQDFPNMSLQ